MPESNALRFSASWQLLAASPKEDLLSKIGKIRENLEGLNEESGDAGTAEWETGED
jgi:hypothetical protein